METPHGQASSRRVSAKLSALAPSATLAVDARAKALKAAGESVVGFGAGEPDFPTPAALVEAAVVVSALARSGLRSLVFVRSRKVAELRPGCE